MASTLPLFQPRYAGTISGNQPLMRTYALASGAVIHAGDVVVSSSGLAAPSATPVPTGNTVLGIAAHGAKQGQAWYLVPEDGSAPLQLEDTGGTFGGTFMGGANLLGSVEGIGVHVIVANRDTLFEISLVQPIALSLLGTGVGIVQNSGVWQATTAAGGTGQPAVVATIVAIPNYVGMIVNAGGTVTVYNPIPASGATGDTNYPVIITFNASATVM